MEIGDIIHKRRKELGYTLEEIGNIVGVGKSTVKKWESGAIANIKRDKIARLAAALQIDPVIFISSDINIDSAKYNTFNNVASDEESSRLDAELISRLCSLTEGELDLVDAFVQGLLSKH